MARLFLCAALCLSVFCIPQVHAETGDPEFDWAVAWGAMWANTASVAVDSQGNVLSAGFFWWSDDLDPGTGTAPTTAVALEAYVLKLDSDGNYIWGHSFGDNTTSYGLDSTESIAVDADDNVLVVGVYEGVVDFNPGAGTATRDSEVDGSLFILKLDADGNFAG